MSGKFRFSIDRGGTFTDIHAVLPNGSERVYKLLSEDPQNYSDAPREGIFRILKEWFSKISNDPSFLVENVGTKSLVNAKHIEWIRMGTTVATNALLERKGARVALITSRGFRDGLEIGHQARPQIFDLTAHKNRPLYETVIEIEERVQVITESSMGSEDSVELVETFPIGVTGERVRILRSPDPKEIRSQLSKLLDSGIESLAVCLLHSYAWPHHELLIGEIAQQLGFGHVSLSHVVSPMIKFVGRGSTACVDAYLTPLLHKYVRSFLAGFESHSLQNVAVSFMRSDGGLCPVDQFAGVRAILSGPAGGVVGYARTAFEPSRNQPVIGFDMGGTSTDVSRYAGRFQHVFDAELNGIALQVPQLDISTVAAGGGSKLRFESGLFHVGPDSVGAHPGPVCYRKKGSLAITDANLFLGRLVPDFFPHIFGPNENQPLDSLATQQAFLHLTEEINHFFAQKHATHPQVLTPDEVAYGFLRVANEAMCRPIRSITEAKGFECSSHVLACFGGAGGQHACAVARTLGIQTVLIHRHAGILSAYGLGLADVVTEAQEPCTRLYSPSNLEFAYQVVERLKSVAFSKLNNQFSHDQVSYECFLNLRYNGTDTSIMILLRPDYSPEQSFLEQYKREYGFIIENKSIIIDDIRIRAIGKSPNNNVQLDLTRIKQTEPPKACSFVSTYFEGQGRVQTPVFLLQQLGSDCKIAGPALIIDSNSTIVVENECEAHITEAGNIEIQIGSVSRKKIGTELDSVLLSVFSHRFMSIAEQMGKTLQRTAISTNIKERLDFSCALFGPDGGLVANAPHLPVHLGSMQDAVRWQIRHLGSEWKEGQVIMSNHPSAGGSHLPDITVITPVYSESRPIFYVASRGHHADIGGSTPGSMPPFSRSLDEEGACFKSFTLVDNGVFQEQKVIELFQAPANKTVVLNNQLVRMSGSRNLHDNLSDLKAQIAANQKGIRLIGELIATYGVEVVQAYMGHIQTAAEMAVREMLVSISLTFKLQSVDTIRAKDWMDDGSKIKLALTIDRTNGSAIFDFSGTSPQVLGNTNAPRAVTASAVIYCLRCLIKRDIPLNQGCLNPIRIIVPENSLLDPTEGAAVVGGNVLTSQRVTDVVLMAFRASACSQGCMNNLTFGNESVGYYETIAGGSGAGPSWHGAHATQVHMTNTRITDPEILERRYPVRLLRFAIRENSGGSGLFRGGNGVIREIMFLRDNYTVGILSERRVFSPWGLNGGGNAKKGKNLLIKKSGLIINLGPKNTAQVQSGDIIRIETPGGGGYGKSE